MSVERCVCVAGKSVAQRLQRSDCPTARSTKLNFEVVVIMSVTDASPLSPDAGVGVLSPAGASASDAVFSALSSSLPSPSSGLSCCQGTSDELCELVTGMDQREQRAERGPESAADQRTEAGGAGTDMTRRCVMYMVKIACDRLDRAFIMVPAVARARLPRCNRLLTERKQKSRRREQD